MFAEYVKIWTFKSTFCGYCFLRLSSGICTAPKVFHSTATQMLEDFAAVKVHVNDTIE